MTSDDVLQCPRCGRELLPVTLEMIDLEALEPPTSGSRLADSIIFGIAPRSWRSPRLEARRGDKRRSRKNGGWIVHRSLTPPGIRCGSCKVTVVL